jgi:hypothetical protein
MARTRRAAASSPVEVTAIRLPDGPSAGVVRDSDGFAVIGSFSTVPGGPLRTGLTLAALESLLDPRQGGLRTVQVVLHADLAPGDADSDLSAAYDNLGYHRVPRSSSAWMVLRPVAGPDGVAGVAAALSRLEGSVRVQLADAGLASDLVATTEPPPDGGGAAYQFTCWPLGGLSALHQALVMIPALSVTTTVTMHLADDGQIRLSATTSIATGRRLGRHALDRAVAVAAAPFGSCLAPASGRFRRAAGRTLNAVRSEVIPIASGGVVLGTAADGDLISVPLFTERGVRAAALGDTGLPKLLVLRALGAGARVQVVTSHPAPWLALRDESRLPAERMTVVPPGTRPPADGSRTAPWMIMDDTGSPATAAVTRPWQAFVAAPDADEVTIAALRGLDSIILHRSTPACRAAAIVAMDLPVPVARSLHGIPRDVIAIAGPGSVSLVPVTPDATEQTLLARSFSTRETPAGLASPASPAWPGSPLLAELGPSGPASLGPSGPASLGPRAWLSDDCRPTPELTGAVSVGAGHGGPVREDA